MKLRKVFIAPILLLTLTGCSNSKEFLASDYIVKRLSFDKTHFNILQFNDIHFSYNTDLEYHFKFMELSIKDAVQLCQNNNEDLNLIVINGDAFMFANEQVIRETFDWFDTHQIPWTYAFGNHDYQGINNDHYIEELLDTRAYQNVCFKAFDDEVSGQSNFVIDLFKNSEHVYQLYFFDSHAMRYKDYFGYDYIKEDQIEWYKWMNKETNVNEVNSSAFFHIPLPEFKEAASMIEIDPSVNKEGGGVHEPVCSPLYNSGLFTAFKENNTISVHCAHDHLNNFEVEYEGIKLCYGLKSTNLHDHIESMIGATLISVKDDYKTVTTKSLLHSYSELD